MGKQTVLCTRPENSFGVLFEKSGQMGRTKHGVLDRGTDNKRGK
jgi:hypothetical protein